MGNYIPMIVALLSWVALWAYLMTVDSKVKRIKKHE